MHSALATLSVRGSLTSPRIGGVSLWAGFTVDLRSIVIRFGTVNGPGGGSRAFQALPFLHDNNTRHTRPEQVLCTRMKHAQPERRGCVSIQSATLLYGVAPAAKSFTLNESNATATAGRRDFSTY